MNPPNDNVATPQLGYFLTFRHWESAIKLLNYQLEIKKTNKHFNTLSMFYYEKLEKDAKSLQDEEYFKKRIANNLFYGLEEEFAILPYPIPKTNLGLRNYKFFTYPMRVLYYSLVIYLLELSQEFLEEYYLQHRHIFSKYGGKLSFDGEKNEIGLTYNSIWYKPHYKQFRNQVRNEVQAEPDHKIVIHVDIQNYYDDISIQTLLGFLYEYIKPSIVRKLRFDPITHSQIAVFFDFMANSRLGIPQTDNDVTSSFLGHLYLVFGDLLLDQELQKDNKLVRHHRIIRYMDDIYISITFHDSAASTDREIYINSLSARIADCLYHRLGLRLNTKTKLFWLSQESEKEDLLKNLKKVSPGYEIPEDDTREHPQLKVDKILRQMEKLKKTPLDPTFKLRRELDSEILKEIYTDSVGAILRKNENKELINRAFQDFNFDLVIAQPREIIILLLLDPQASKEFRRFLLKKQDLTSRDVHLILTYLCQTEFKHNKLIKLLRDSKQMRKIMKLYRSGKLSSEFPGYYGLGEKQVLKLSELHNVIEQVRLRVLAERQNQYSIALNHLLNEIHAICSKLDTRPIEEKKYDVNAAMEYLRSSAIPHETRMKIRNLFDRRNKNPVSHADPIAWPVSKEEYFDYHSHVANCLKFIL